MSVKIMSQIWELDLPATEKLIALAFGDHANDKGICCPSFARIAWKSGVSKDTVQRAVKRFIDVELLKKLREAGGRGHPPLWRISPERAGMLPPFISDLERSKVVEKPVDLLLKPGGNGAHGPVERGAAGGERGGTGHTSAEPKTGILEMEPKAASTSPNACGNLPKKQLKNELHRLASRKSLDGERLVEPSDEEKQKRIEQLHEQRRMLEQAYKTTASTPNEAECDSNSREETGAVQYASSHGND